MKRGDEVELADGTIHHIHCIRPDRWVVLQTMGELGLSLQVPLASLDMYAPGHYRERKSE